MGSTNTNICSHTFSQWNPFRLNHRKVLYSPLLSWHFQMAYLKFCKEPVEWLLVLRSLGRGPIRPGGWRDGGSEAAAGPCSQIQVTYIEGECVQLFFSILFYGFVYNALPDRWHGASEFTLFSSQWATWPGASFLPACLSLSFPCLEWHVQQQWGTQIQALTWILNIICPALERQKRSFSHWYQS